MKSTSLRRSISRVSSTCAEIKGGAASPGTAPPIVAGNLVRDRRNHMTFYEKSAIGTSRRGRPRWGNTRRGRLACVDPESTPPIAAGSTPTDCAILSRPNEMAGLLRCAQKPKQPRPRGRRVRCLPLPGDCAQRVCRRPGNPSRLGSRMTLLANRHVAPERISATWTPSAFHRVLHETQI